MDRTFEEVRDAALELDRESKRRLADVIEEDLAEDGPSEADFEEAYQRLEAYDRGEMTAMTAEESMAEVRQLIAEYKKKQL